MKQFKPLLAPNDSIELNMLQYPLVGSYKLDGIRCIFKDGNTLSRALKVVPNRRVREKFSDIADFVRRETRLDAILDGELLSRSMTFGDLSGLIRTLDKAVPDDLKFYIFDVVVEDKFDEPFSLRTERAKKLARIFHELVVYIDQVQLNNASEVQDYYQKALADGYEGLILRNPDGRYKTGRATVKENIIYKVKPFETFDAKIIGVEQATQVDPDAVKKINELGYSVTSKKLGDRILIGKACNFVVQYKGKNLSVVIAQTDEQKTEIWKNRDRYIGRHIEYKGMLVGSKDLPRHPVFLRYRTDKD